MVSKHATALQEAYPGSISSSSSSYGFLNERTGKLVPLGKVLSEAGEEEVMTCDSLVLLPAEMMSAGDDDDDDDGEGVGSHADDAAQVQEDVVTRQGGQTAVPDDAPAVEEEDEGGEKNQEEEEEEEASVVIIVQHGKVGHRVVFTSGMYVCMAVCMYVCMFIIRKRPLRDCLLTYLHTTPLPYIHR